MTAEDIKKVEESLNEKQKRFALEYLTDFNATQSAIRAGYSKDTAGSIGHELLKKHEIQMFLSYHKDQKAAALGLRAEDVLREYMKIGFSNVVDFINEDGAINSNLNAVDRTKTASISSISITETVGDFGTQTRTSFRMHNKIGALDRLAEYLGIIKKDGAFDENAIIIVRRPERPANG